MLVLFLVVLFAFAVQPWAFAVPGSLKLISTNGEGVKGNLPSVVEGVSADGTKVAFTSAAGNLDPGDPGNSWDVYVKDVVSGELTLASVTPDGTPIGGGDSAVSADGSRVAFATAAKLDPADTDFSADVYLKDLTDGTLTFVATDVDGTKAVAASYFPAISADGTKIAFQSTETPSEPIPRYDIYVKDLSSGALSLVSSNDGGVSANGSSEYPTISADGSKVAFHSEATNLDAADSDPNHDVYVKDLVDGSVTLASTTATGVKGNVFNSVASLSTDGGIVAFNSGATNLDPADADGYVDIYVKDMTSGTLTLAHTTSSGVKLAAGGAIDPSLSADGTRVAMTSYANLDPADNDGQPDVYVKDLTTGQMQLASSSSAGADGDGGSDRPHISADGSAVAFTSTSTNVDPGDADSNHDGYLKELSSSGPTPVTVDLKIKKQGTNYAVSVLGAPGFDAATIDVASVCFGDAEEPGERDCTELDGSGVVKDVDRDQDLDMTLQFEASEAGLDSGDTQACLTGMTADGAPIKGCAPIPTKKR